MKFKQYAHFDALAHLRDDWDDLLSKSVSNGPFLSFDYLQAWWETRGGGEWPLESELVLVAAFEGDSLAGIAPLFQAKNQLGRPTLMFVGAIEVSDFLDFIVKPEDLAPFLSGLLDYLINANEVPEWETLDFYNILEGSPSLAALEAEAARRGWTHEQMQLQPSPYIPLPGDFDAYMAGINKKQRHEIRRKLRNVEQSLAEPGYYFVEDAESLHVETQAFIDMMAQDPTKREFLSEAMVEHLHNTAQVAFDHGWLHLAFFTLDGKKAAGNFSFIYNHRLWLYNSAWEWEYQEFSPGWVLLTHLLEWATANGIEEFDFMRGDEAYKYKFGGKNRFIYRVTLEK